MNFMKTDPNGELKPVMVWIHGGGFISGSGNGESNLYGPNYIMDRDVVLVTINYRLGALGRHYLKIREGFSRSLFYYHYCRFLQDFLQPKMPRPLEIMDSLIKPLLLSIK